MRFFTVSILSALAALASATTTLPDYSSGPSGNPILLPGLNEQVPVGEPYQIKWTPTTEGDVSIWLLRGPSTNVKPIATLASSIPNSGEFTWTPSTTLQDDTTHYGLIIIVEGTGQYQYSTQFGIKNDAVPASSTAVASSTTATTTASASSVSASASASSSSSSSTVVVATTTPIQAAVVASSTSSTSAVETTATATPAIPSNTVVSVSVPTLAASSSAVAATTFSSSVSVAKPSKSPAASATYTGAADRKTAGFGAVAVAAGLMAVFAF